MHRQLLPGVARSLPFEIYLQDLKSGKWNEFGKVESVGLDF